MQFQLQLVVGLEKRVILRQVRATPIILYFLLAMLMMFKFACPFAHLLLAQLIISNIIKEIKSTLNQHNRTSNIHYSYS
jgi:hypothetical protein